MAMQRMGVRKEAAKAPTLRHIGTAQNGPQGNLQHHPRRTGALAMVVTWLAILAVVLGGTAALAADSDKPKEAKGTPVATGGILTTDQNKDSLMVLTDGEETPVKYVFADTLDKKSVQDIFSLTRILITYAQGDDARKLLSIKKATVPATGTVTGAVQFSTDFWVAVKPKNGPADGYALGQWPAGEMGTKLKALHPGDIVTVKFRTDSERHRINSLDVVSLAPPSPDAKATLDKDLEYGKAGGTSLKLDLYRPKDRPAGPLPVILWFHGGGWNTGSRQWLAGTKIDAFLQRGYCFASIEYRLSGAAKFPAAVQDGKCAVRWVRKNAPAYGFDPQRIGVMGYSSGGHLALMLGCAQDQPNLEGHGGNDGASSRVQAVCAIAGPTDLAAFPKGSQGEGVVKDFCGGTLAEIPEVYKHASPINYVSKDNPPILLIQGEKDEVVPIAQSENLEKKLHDAGAKVQFIRIKNYDHGKAVGKQDPSPEELLKAKLDFFDATLKAPPAAPTSQPTGSIR